MENNTQVSTFIRTKTRTHILLLYQVKYFCSCVALTYSITTDWAWTRVATDLGVELTHWLFAAFTGWLLQVTIGGNTVVVRATVGDRKWSYHMINLVQIQYKIPFCISWCNTHLIYPAKPYGGTTTQQTEGQLRAITTNDLDVFSPFVLTGLHTCIVQSWRSHNYTDSHSRPSISDLGNTAWSCTHTRLQWYNQYTYTGSFKRARSWKISILQTQKKNQTLLYLIFLILSFFILTCWNLWSEYCINKTLNDPEGVSTINICRVWYKHA